MHTRQTKYQKHLFIVLSCVFLVWLVPFILGKNFAVLTSDFFYIPLTIWLSVFSLYRVLESKVLLEKITWVLFFTYAILDLLANHIWTFDELILDVKPFPSYADIAWLAAYFVIIPFYFLFIMPLKNYISKGILAAAILISVAIISFNAYFLVPINNTSPQEVFLASYPVLMGIAAGPATIGIILYFKHKTSFSSLLICSAIFTQWIGDSLFQIGQGNGTYYSGSYADLFLFLSYPLFIFGIYQAKIRTSKIEVEK